MFRSMICSQNTLQAKETLFVPPFVRMGLRLSCVSQEKAAAAEAAATAAQRAFLEAEASLTLDTSTAVNPNAQTALSAEEFVNKH